MGAIVRSKRVPLRIVRAIPNAAAGKMDKANRIRCAENALIKLHRRFEIRAKRFARVGLAPGEIGLAGGVDDRVGRNGFDDLARKIVDVMWPDVDFEIR